MMFQDHCKAVNCDPVLIVIYLTRVTPVIVRPTQVWVTLDIAFCSASIYSLVGISVDRFYAIYRPVM